LELKTVVNEIKKQNLLENVRITGTFLKDGLNELSSKYPQWITAVRGRGTFLAFDTPSTEAQGWSKKETGLPLPFLPLPLVFLVLVLLYFPSVKPNCTFYLKGKLVSKVRSNGVELGGCGEKAIRIRPMLTFTPTHAAQLLDILEKSFKELA
jgi:4-aminobutyrate aminotransferase/(S)-3-amino-2-methylpropionate transaminase